MQYWQHPNTSVLGGRITNDLQLKNIKTNNAVLEFSVANNLKSTYVDDGGVKTPDKAHFFRCEAWGKLAEILASQFKKGDAIILTGYWVWSSWVAQDGTKREAQSLNVQGFHHAQGNNGNGNSAPANTSNNVTYTTPVEVPRDVAMQNDNTARIAAKYRPTPPPPVVPEDDSIPF